MGANRRAALSDTAANGLGRLNALSPHAAERMLLAVCGSREWARSMAAARPFPSVEAALDASDRTWGALSASDWNEALASHSRIGDRAATGTAAREQSAALGASPEIQAALARANAEYEEHFGRIFVVCAAGRSAREMLALCRQRLHNDPETELSAAAEEQRKINRLRLEALARGE